ncbi:DNA-processing protein DprA, partial [Adlercreutzia equolifaciens]|uniref:DNA-processing protein DprA n=1 Tax=Adlercreutzia equolifaciens TaxID=446660 RepID=UPI002430B82F
LPGVVRALRERIVAAGGAVVSEHEWDFPPQPHTFRARNRLIAGLSRATLIVEAGLPSGTFSTADEALLAGREVWVVPGAITSAASKGANRLLYQGALPIVDDDAFADALFSTFGCLKEQRAEAADDRGKASQPYRGEEALLSALQAEPLGMEALRQLAEDHAPAGDTFTWLMIWLAEAQRDGLIAQYPDGRYGPHPALRTAV